MTSSLLLALWLQVIPGPVPTPPSTAAFGAFAFPDAGGTRLLVTGMLAAPETLTTAICGGRLLGPVAFDRRQGAGEGASGRQAPWDFDAAAGAVFRLHGRSVGGGETCFLAANAFLSGTGVLHVARTDSPDRCPAGIGRHLTALRARSVVHCWVIGRLDEGSVLLAEYERLGADALASIVLMDRDRTAFADLRATYRGQGQDLWRAGDEGSLSPEAFEVVFAVRRGSFHAIGISWSGEEGVSLSVFAGSQDGSLSEVLQDYWYQAPR